MFQFVLKCTEWTSMFTTVVYEYLKNSSARCARFCPDTECYFNEKGGSLPGEQNVKYL